MCEYSSLVLQSIDCNSVVLWISHHGWLSTLAGNVKKARIDVSSKSPSLEKQKGGEKAPEPRLHLDAIANDMSSRSCSIGDRTQTKMRRTQSSLLSFKLREVRVFS